MNDGPLRMDIIIPTFNRAAALVRCLESIAAQADRRGLMVIVIDDGSEVPAVECIPRSLSERLDIRVLRQENAGPARARNAGIAASNADYIGFVDDDVCIDPGWLAAYRRVISQDARGAFAYFGPLAAPANWRPTPWNRWEANTLRVEYGRMTAGLYEPTWRQFFTGNAVVRRDLILQAGGFNEGFTRAEDIELGLRLKLRCGVTFRFVNEAVGWHYAHRSLESWLRIPRAYGHYEVLIDTLHPESRHAETLFEELSERRSRMARLIRTPARNERLRAAGVWTATRAAIVLSRAGANLAASRLLSLAYDAEYSQAFFENFAVAQASRLDRGEQPINSASTCGEYVQP